MAFKWHVESHPNLIIDFRGLHILIVRNYERSRTSPDAFCRQRNHQVLKKQNYLLKDHLPDKITTFSKAIRKGNTSLPRAVVNGEHCPRGNSMVGIRQHAVLHVVA